METFIVADTSKTTTTEFQQQQQQINGDELKKRKKETQSVKDTCNCIGFICFMK